MSRFSKILRRCLVVLCAAAALTSGFVPSPALASSHMDAPLVTLDPAANTTDVYAFVTEREGRKFLSTALAVYPHEEPGIGPNKYNFDDDVLYEIHVATGPDVAAGRATFSYRFRFSTAFKNRQTILQSYLGVVQDVGDAAQNLTQTYTVSRVDVRTGRETVLGTNLLVPPNNQGRATPFYNRGDNGDDFAKDGVDRGRPLDRYTAQSIATLADGSRVFAGQREDGFYADVNAIFDLLSLRGGTQRFDSQSGFNVHVIALNIPVDTLGGDMQIAGVYATTSRKKINVLRRAGKDPAGPFVQVGRQGNPLFCEALVGIEDKDLYNRSKPTEDAALFRKYAENPELARLLNALVLGPAGLPAGAIETGRTDLVGIFVPDLIKVDLSTGPARLAGGGPNHPTNPDDAGYSRLGIFGVFVPGENPDVLQSRIGAGFLGNGTQPGGWPNGRRFGDDVVDIAVLALASDLRDPLAPQVPASGLPAALLPALTDGINKNDSVYSKVLPYAGTPHNGRSSRHNPQQPPQPDVIN